jgi:hypothetical protein
MKRNHASLAALFLLTASAQGLAADRELCQAGYPVMLMTENECKAYLVIRTRLQGSGDVAALQLLDSRMQDQLMERAAACPCAALGPVKVALSQNDGC